MAGNTGRALRRQRFQSRDTEINVVSLIDIFAILVFYLLVNALVVEVIPRYEDLFLPNTSALQQPSDDLVLAISRDSIYINETLLMQRQAMTANATEAAATLVAALRRAQAVKSPGAENGDGRSLNIVADREIPYVLLKRILASCTEAGFSRVLLTVEQPRGLS